MTGDNLFDRVPTQRLTATVLRPRGELKQNPIKSQSRGGPWMEQFARREDLELAEFGGACAAPPACTGREEYVGDTNAHFVSSGKGHKDAKEKVTKDDRLQIKIEFIAHITKVAGKDVTFMPVFKEDEKAIFRPFKDARTIGDLIERAGKTATRPAAQDIKVNKGYYDVRNRKMVVTGPLEGGLKNPLFTGKKGIGAGITTSADKESITAITVDTERPPPPPVRP